jgi:hypothetical protein
VPAALLSRAVVLSLVAAGCSHRQPEQADPSSEVLPQVGRTELRTPEVFDSIADKADRSRALFLEASRVLFHPRCANCHPDGDTPYQGADQRPHDPPAFRGPEDRGVVGMECTSCHQDRNLALARVPGAANWHLAPRSMAWVGRSPRSVCEQLKDSTRNGGRTLAQIVDHSKHDELVGWGWAPGSEREPAPGSQERFGALVSAWVETGAECPSEEVRP